MKTVAIWAAILLAAGWDLFMCSAFFYIVYDSLRCAVAEWRGRRKYRHG